MKLVYNDRQHAYWLDGKRCKSVTQVAKIPDDQFTLSKWRQRMIAIGMASDPDLIERAAAHYDDRDILDAICDEAAKAAGAHRKADRGTAAHRITERHDAGELIIETDFSRRVRDAWQQAMEDAGLEVACDSQGRPLQERVVVWPEQLVCGKFDRICRRADGSLVVVDLKTGTGAIKYPHSIAIQLALYAYAPLIAGPLPAGGGSTEEFERPYAFTDMDVGLVVHMPDEGPVQVYEFDIYAGHNAAGAVCFGALAWRKQASLCWPLGARSEPDGGTDGKGRPLDRDLAQKPDPHGPDDDHDRGGAGRTDRPVAPDPGPVALGARSEDGRQPVAAAGPAGPDEDQRPDSPGMVDVVQRHVPPPAGPALDPAALLADIEALPPDVLDYLKRQWRRFPHMANPPSVKRGEKGWLPIEREVIADLIQQAKDACLYATPAETAERIEEGRRELIERSRRSNDARDGQPVAGAGTGEAAAGRGGRERMGAVANTKDDAHTRVCAVDEGPPADPAAIDALTRNLAKLTAPQQNIIKDWLAQAKAAGVFFGNLKQNPSIRRFALARACWALVAHMDGEDKVVRAALAFVAGDDAVQPAFPTGAIIGALTPEQADRLHEVATGIGERYILGAGRLEAVA